MENEDFRGLFRKINLGLRFCVARGSDMSRRAHNAGLGKWEGWCVSSSFVSSLMWWVWYAPVWVAPITVIGRSWGEEEKKTKKVQVAQSKVTDIGDLPKLNMRNYGPTRRKSGGSLVVFGACEMENERCFSLDKRRRTLMVKLSSPTLV